MRRVPSKRDDGISSYVGIPDKIPRERRKKKNDEEHDTHVEHRHLHTTIHSSFAAAMIRMKERLSMGTTQSVLKARINL